MAATKRVSSAARPRPGGAVSVVEPKDGQVASNGTVFIQKYETWLRLLSEKRPMVVMFTSRMCGACHSIRGKYPAMKSHLPQDTLLAVVDLDKSDQAICTSALGQIAFVPAFQVFFEGDRVDYFIASHEDALTEKIDQVSLDLQKKEKKRNSHRQVGCFDCFSGMLNGNISSKTA